MGWGMELWGVLSLAVALAGLGLSFAFPPGPWRLVVFQVAALAGGAAATTSWEASEMGLQPSWPLAGVLLGLILGLGAWTLGRLRWVDLAGLAVAGGAVIFGAGAFLAVGGWFAVSAVTSWLIVTVPVFHLAARLTVMAGGLARGLAPAWLLVMDGLFLAHLMAKVDAGDGPAGWMVLTALTGEGPGYASSRPPALIDALVQGEWQAELYNLALTILFLAVWALVLLRRPRDAGDG